MKDVTSHSTWASYRTSYCKMSKCQAGLNGNAVAQHSCEWQEFCMWRFHSCAEYSFFPGCKGRSWTCSPHPFLQQNGLHGILRKLPKPEVALLHAIFLLIICKVAWFQSSCLGVLITLGVADGTSAQQQHASRQWAVNMQSHLHERRFCKPFNLNMFNKREQIHNQKCKT